ncbi:MAG TPA: class I SAM-dependent methyltransferase [Candidatus Manganitrophaceae bacterium]|nr:class I SAM-dependent methyltransferase [Candidatus Manganitrophaceae bacterium]
MRIASGAAYLKRAARQTIRRSIPLPVRKRMAVWIDRQKWINADRRAWWSVELIQDLAQKNAGEYHKFLWSNHLAYAASYEASARFGAENMKPSRRMFFSDLRRHLDPSRIDPMRAPLSIFEVGCSSGYQLRYLETDLFPMAKELEGVDIDPYAIDSGSEYLRRVGSKVRLKRGDIEDLDRLMGGKTYDLILCTGVLMYLNEEAAAKVVGAMIRRAGALVALAGLASPDIDNARLQRSIPRDRDRSFVHNIDAMVTNAGGTILARRWEGARLVDGHTIYFVFATGNPQQERNVS